MLGHLLNLAADRCRQPTPTPLS